LTLSPPREISRTAVNQLALPYRAGNVAFIGLLFFAATF
jgi:hypothetical protein